VCHERGNRPPSSSLALSAQTEGDEEAKANQIRLSKKNALTIEIREPKEEIVFHI